MKSQTFTKRHALRTLGLLGLFTIFSLAINPLLAQTERTVKGIVSDEDGFMENATVILKGTNIYVETDEKGAFTFPQKLKENETLIISHLGFKNQEVTIDSDTTFVDILMADYAIVVVGALKIGDNSTTKGINH